MGFAMLSTVDWANEMYSEFQTERYSTHTTTTSYESTSISLVPFQSVLAFIGFFGVFTNGLVLFGFWRSDRFKLTSSSVHIINHTTLELHTVVALLEFHNHHFLDLQYIIYLYFCKLVSIRRLSSLSWIYCIPPFSWPACVCLPIRPLSWSHV